MTAVELESTSESPLTQVQPFVENGESLKLLLKERIVNDIIKDAQSGAKDTQQATSEQNYFILIGDDITIKILDYVMRMHELRDLNVRLIVNVNKKRDRVQLSPIYFITPTEESVNNMINDFSGKVPQYRGVIHCYFGGYLDPASKLISKIKNSAMAPYLGDLKEIPCNLFAIKSKIFTVNPVFELGDSVSEHKQSQTATSTSTATAATDEKKNDIDDGDRFKAVDSIVSLVFALNSKENDKLNIIPNVNIRYSRASSKAKFLAQDVEARLEKFASQIVRPARTGKTDEKETDTEANTKSKTKTKTKTKANTNATDGTLTELKSTEELDSNPINDRKVENINLIIMDRFDDLVTPLLHSNRLEALMMDTIGKTNRNKGRNNDDDMLSDDNDIWKKYRHKYIDDVMTHLPKEFEIWEENNIVAKYHNQIEIDESQKAKMEIKEIRQVIRSLANYKELTKEYSVVLDVANELLSIWDEYKLYKIIELEQQLITGINNNGEECTRKQVRMNLANVLKQKLDTSTSNTTTNTTGIDDKKDIKQMKGVDDININENVIMNMDKITDVKISSKQWQEWKLRVLILDLVCELLALGEGDGDGSNNDGGTAQGQDATAKKYQDLIKPSDIEDIDSAYKIISNLISRESKIYNTLIIHKKIYSKYWKYVLREAKKETSLIETPETNPIWRFKNYLEWVLRSELNNVIDEEYFPMLPKKLNTDKTKKNKNKKKKNANDKKKKEQEKNDEQSEQKQDKVDDDNGGDASQFLNKMQIGIDTFVSNVEKDVNSLIDKVGKEVLSDNEAEKEKENENKKKSHNKTIVYVVGGITYQEIESVYSLNQEYKKCSVFAGSTCVLDSAAVINIFK